MRHQKSELFPGSVVSSIFGSVASVALVVAVLGGALGCAPPSDPPVADSSPVPAEPARLPVSLNDVMAALVNHAADPIWIAAWHDPETDEEWRDLERHAYQLELAGALLEMPGTGPMDDEWASNPEWLRWARDLRSASELAVAAIEARDQSTISSAGDRIVEVCEGCHFEFKPDMPTGGKFGEISPNAADLEDDEE